MVDPFRPRSNPLAEYFAALNRLQFPGMTDPTSNGAGPEALATSVLALRRAAARPAAKVLLVVDQAEELLGTEEGSLFLSQLRHAAEHREGPAVIVCTLRSDFLERFQNSPPLLDLRYEVLTLGPMSRDDVIEIIEEPAKVVDLELEPKLVSTLVDEASARTHSTACLHAPRTVGTLRQ